MKRAPLPPPSTTLDDKTLLRLLRGEILRFDERTLSTRLAVLVAATRVEVQPRFSVAIALEDAGRKEAAHLVRNTNVPLGAVLLVHAPRGLPIVEVFWPWGRP
jgi:hypothetical protein